MVRPGQVLKTLATGLALISRGRATGDNKLLRTPVGRFRAIALVEGISYLLLLGVAMPLKYFAGFPEAVLAVGWVHGVLFVLYLVSLCEVSLARRWRLWRILGAFVASLVPFGTFVLDARLRREGSAA